MSNLPPCGACSYTSASETLSISLSSFFVGTLSDGRLTLRSDTGEVVEHDLPNRLVGGQKILVKGLSKPPGARIASATIEWLVSGDPDGQTRIEESLFVEQ